MEQSGVFLVGLHIAELTLVLGALGLEVLHLQLQALSVLRHVIEGGFRRVHGGPVGHDLGLDRRLLLWKGHKLAVETSQLHVGAVEIHKRLKIRVHRRIPILPFAGFAYSTQISIVSPSSPTMDTISRMLRARRRFQKPSAS